jgi:hypothetical protein
MKPSSAKQKGKLLEDHVADQIVAKGIDLKARRDGASGAGNREKGDIITSMTILGVNAGIECKNQATLAIPEWWRQTKKLESLGREPVLAFKIYGEPMEDTKVVIYLDTFLELVKNQKGWTERAVGESKTIEKERALVMILEGAKKLEQLS